MDTSPKPATKKEQASVHSPTLRGLEARYISGKLDSLGKEVSEFRSDFLVNRDWADSVVYKLFLANDSTRRDVRGLREVVDSLRTKKGPHPRIYGR